MKFDLFDKFANPFKKSVEPLMRRSEEDIIAAIIDRIPVRDEPQVPEDADKSTKKEDEFRRLLRRLEPQFAATGITNGEMLRYYEGPLYALMLLSFMEKYKKKTSLVIRDRLIGLGFVLLQNNVWVLPPARTPQDLRTQEDLKVWVKGTLTKALRKDYQYVMPFVALVDLKKVIAEKHRVVKQPEGRTIFTILERKELLPASYVYDYMKRKGFSVDGMIRGGDLGFLISAFADSETMEALLRNKDEATRRVRRLMNMEGLTLSYLADLHEKELGGALEGLVPHPVEVARRLGVEAQYWERFLEGEGRVGGAEENKEKSIGRIASLGAVVCLAGLVAVSLALAQGFSTLKLLIAESLGGILLALVAYRVLSTRSEALGEPGYARLPLVQISLAMTLLSWAPVWASEWYPLFWYYVLISVAVGVLCPGLILKREPHGGEVAWSLIAILALGFTLKSAVYATNLTFYNADGLAHYLFTAVTASTGHTFLGMGYYYYYPGFHILSAMVMVVTGFPPVMFPVAPFVMAVVGLLPVYILGKRIAGERVGLLAALIFSISVLPNFSWTPVVTALTFGSYAVYFIYMSRADPSQSGRPFTLLVWLMFVAAALTYPNAALAILFVTFSEAAWRYWRSRSVSLIGIGEIVLLVIGLNASRLVANIVRAVSTGTTNQIPTVVPSSQQVTVLYWAQYVVNLFPIVLPLSLGVLGAMFLIQGPIRRGEFILIVSGATVLGLPLLMLLSGTFILEVGTVFLYFLVFFSPLAAVAAIRASQSARSRTVALVTVTVLLGVGVFANAIYYAPDVYLFRGATGFSPFYPAPSTVLFSAFAPHLPRDATVTTDGSTFITALGNLNETFSPVAQGGGLVPHSIVVINRQELSRLFGISGSSALNDAVNLLSNNPSYQRVYDSSNVTVLIP